MAIFLGTNETDVIAGTANDDSIFGFFGNDELGGFGGNDVSNGNQGNDTIFGYEGNVSGLASRALTVSTVAPVTIHWRVDRMPTFSVSHPARR